MGETWSCSETERLLATRTKSLPELHHSGVQTNRLTFNEAFSPQRPHCEKILQRRQIVSTGYRESGRRFISSQSREQQTTQKSLNTLRVLLTSSAASPAAVTEASTYTNAAFVAIHTRFIWNQNSPNVWFYKMNDSVYLAFNYSRANLPHALYNVEYMFIRQRVTEWCFDVR